jgi:hypothetical protein
MGARGWPGRVCSSGGRSTGNRVTLPGLRQYDSDARLADLQDEARRRLPLADLQDRVAVIATAP